MARVFSDDDGHERCSDCFGYTAAEARKRTKRWLWRPGKFCSCPYDAEHP